MHIHILAEEKWLWDSLQPNRYAQVPRVKLIFNSLPQLLPKHKNPPKSFCAISHHSTVFFWKIWKYNSESICVYGGKFVVTFLLACSASLDFLVRMRDLDKVACWQLWCKAVKGQGSPFEAELDNTEQSLFGIYCKFLPKMIGEMNLLCSESVRFPEFIYV